ncbi:MAG: T9SS type A sorting domain-containing protein [Candidatus Marinimicrobia bacterium]|nr:T9SS type A sorting domain-containing protein [Candidatus Neomarinimicrobiota bacterium]
MNTLKSFSKIFGSILVVFSMVSAQVNWTHITAGSAPSSTRPVICSDPLGNLHVAWTSDNVYGELVQYATNQYGGWGYQKKAAGRTGDGSYNPSITADRQGFAYIVYRYYGYSFEIKYATNRNITSNYWDVIRQMDSGHYHESSIEVDQDFNTHVFAQEDTYGSNVYYQELNTGNAVIPDGTGHFFGTAIDQNDFLHFVGGHANGVYYTKNSNGSWTVPVEIDQVETAAYHPSITVDNNNNLHVVFASGDGLYYLNNESGDWGTPELISTSCIFPNIVVDENGKAHIAWYTHVESGALYYTNNIDGSWLTPAYIVTINTDISSATEDVAHVESKIAIDPKSNTVNIVYISGGQTVKIAQTSDFRLRSMHTTDTTTTLIANSSINAPDTLSTSATGSIDILGFTVSDAGGDGLPIKINQLIIQRGPGMSTDIGFADVFGQVTLSASNGDSVIGTVYNSKIIFGTLNSVWKNIPEGQSIDFTISGTLKQPLLNVDGKKIEMKVNGLYDVIIDTTGSRFAYTNSDITSGTIFFQVVPDHFEFVKLGSDFYGENLVQGFYMQLKIVDANGTIATSITDVSITLSAVQLDGVTPTQAALSSTEGLTKTFSNGIAQWNNLTYPEAGQIRILASCDVLVDASDTITVMPYFSNILIGTSDGFSDLLNELHIEHDFYHEDNYQFPTSEKLLNYESLYLSPTSIYAWYIDSTQIKSFLTAGSETERKSMLAFGEYALGYNMNSSFADHYFGGTMPNYFNHNATTFQGVSNDPISDGLSLSVPTGMTGILILNENLSGSSVILTHPGSGNSVGIKNSTSDYRTVFIAPNFSSITNTSQRDTLVSRIIRWFQSEFTLQPPVLTTLPEINLTEDIQLKIPFSDWFDYVSDPDTPDEELSWEVSQGNHIQVSSLNDTLYLNPEENFFGKDTLIVTVSDDSTSDSDTLFAIVATVNDPPVLSVIPDTSFNEDEQLRFAIAYFYDFVYDPDNADSTLTWFIPETNNYVHATVNEDSVILSSNNDWFGKATLKLIVSDGEFSDTASFVTTVHPTNDSPYFTGLMPDSIEFDSNVSDTLLLTGLVSDIDSPDSILTWSYIHSSFVFCFINDTLNCAIFRVEENLSGKDTVVLSIFDGEFTVYDSLIVTVNTVTGIEYIMSQIPKEYSLEQNYPNPFNPITNIIYGIPKRSMVEIKIYDLLGREIITLISKEQNAGYLNIVWDAKDNHGNKASSGMYLYRIVAMSDDKVFVKTKKLLLLR